MLRSFLLSATRNLLRRKFFSAINIAGLAIALTVSFMIYSYVSYELSYDTYHTKANRIFRIVTAVKSSNEILRLGAPYAVGPTLQSAFPEIETMTRIDPAGSMLVEAGNKKFQEEHILFADASIFSIFTFDLITGDSTALQAPFTVVLSESAANKYFGKEYSIGKTMSFGDFNATVTGIMRDIPYNSQFRTDIFVSINTIAAKWIPDLNQQWNGFGGDTYVLLPPNYDVEKLKAKLPAFIRQHAEAIIKATNTEFTLDIEPLTSTYLHSEYGKLKKGNVSDIYIFSTISVFILFIACINFINLSLAQSSERAREVGIRKAAGASRKHLIFQFLGESILSSLIAFLFACIFCIVLTPLFNDLSGKSIGFSFINDAVKILSLFTIALLIGIIAGLYPSFVLSSFKPVNVLKGSSRVNRSGVLLRQVLVAFQFSTAIILIAGTIVVIQQVRFMRNQPAGFQQSQMLIVDFYRDKQVIRQLDMIRKQLTRISNVQSVCASYNIPGISNPKSLVGIQSKDGKMSTLNMDKYLVDYDFIHDYEMPVIAGRNFSTNFSTDNLKAAIVNEATVRKLGYTSADDVLGRRFLDRFEGSVIGVVKDFHYRSLREQISPMIFTITSDDFRYFTIKLTGNDIAATLRDIERTWKQVIPYRPIEYFFLDESFNRQYLSEARFGKLFTYFSLFALFISCLGLSGLALFSTSQRTKEIGIRKVLGSSVTGIIKLFTMQFLKPVFVAFIIGIPVGTWLMHIWLQDFAYRIKPDWTVFVMTGCIVFSIAIVTTCSQVMRYASTKPSSTLRMS